MPLQPQELQQGIEYWRQTKWPQDFHNRFYRHLAGIRGLGLFSMEWWEALLPILRQWRATRPRSSEYLTKRAQNRFLALKEIWKKNIIPVEEQDIETIEWQTIASFVQLVAEIKNVQSPVFSSKLCHFLAPQIFPVIDSKAMGNPFGSYESYLNTARQEWRESNHQTRDSLIDLITNEIGSDLNPDYPLKCKIIELCFIGRNQKNS